jgi:hypothetical protein
MPPAADSFGTLLNKMKASLEKLIIAILMSSMGWISIGLTYATLQHLFIDHTYLFDTGYWIGLSAKINPLLIEPSSISSGYSYFNTHFSPIFVLLQLLNKALGMAPGGLFYAAWFCLLGLVPLWIAVSWTIYKLKQSGLPQGARIIFLLSVIFSVWAYVSSNVWIQSFVRYPHTEIIGIQLIGAGWLLLSTNANHLRHSAPYQERTKLLENTGTVLILVGSLFHELIAVFGILALLSIALSQHKSAGSHEHRIFFVSSALISIALLAWTIFRHAGFFPGKHLSESALSRIYLGNPPLAHLNFSTYIENIISLFNNNTTPIAFLIIAIALSIYLQDKGCLLILIAASIYLLASPLAASESASTLGDHYGYPLALGYFTYVGLIAKSVTQGRQEIEARQAHSFSAFKSIAARVAQIPTTFTLIIAISAMINRFNTFINVLVPVPSTNAQAKIILKNKNLWHIAKRPGSILELTRLSTEGSATLARIAHSTQVYPSKKILLADHRIAALLPNDIDYCSLIAPFRRQPNDPCSKLIDRTNPERFVFVSFQPKPGLHDDLVKSETEKLKLSLDKQIPVGTLNGHELTVNMYKRPNKTSTEIWNKN